MQVSSFFLASFFIFPHNPRNTQHLNNSHQGHPAIILHCLRAYGVRQGLFRSLILLLGVNPMPLNALMLIPMLVTRRWWLRLVLGVGEGEGELPGLVP